HGANCGLAVGVSADDFRRDRRRNQRSDLARNRVRQKHCEERRQCQKIDVSRMRISLHAASTLQHNAILWSSKKEVEMAKAKHAVPEGLHTVTPQLVLDNCAQAIEWYKKG